jgi:hypothetical protein
MFHWSNESTESVQAKHKFPLPAKNGYAVRPKTDAPLQVSLDLSIQESPTLIPRIEENTTVGHNFLVE